MKSLIFTDEVNVRVEYIADLLGSNDGNLTIMEIKGLDTAEEALFKGFQKLPNNLEALKKFAIDNALKLTQGDQDAISTIVDSIVYRTVTFNTAGGSTAPANQTIPSGGMIAAPANPTKSSVTFGGWSADSGATIWDFNEDIVTANVALVAQWA